MSKMTKTFFLTLYFVQDMNGGRERIERFLPIFIYMQIFFFFFFFFFCHFRTKLHGMTIRINTTVLTRSLIAAGNMVTRSHNGFQEDTYALTYFFYFFFFLKHSRIGILKTNGS